MKYKRQVEKKEEGKRLDKIIAQYFPAITRSYFKFLIESKKVLVNGAIEKSSYRVKDGDFILWEDFKKNRFLKTDQKLKIIFKNKDLLVIDKPAGIAVHPKETLRPREEITIIDILVKEYPDIKKTDKERPGIVHRLDKETSGLLLVALNKKSLEYLKKQFQARKVKKTYKALVYGRLEPKEGIIEAPIGRDPKDKSKMAVVSEDSGRAAETSYKVLDFFSLGKEIYSLVDVMPKTGRTHQIRVHLSSIGHPIVGDKIYGPRKPKVLLGRQFLHATKLELTIPSGEKKKFEARLSQDLQNFLNDL